MAAKYPLTNPMLEKLEADGGPWPASNTPLARAQAAFGRPRAKVSDEELELLEQTLALKAKL
jgi:hypothetical protein